MHDCWMTYSEENSSTSGMSCTSILHGRIAGTRKRGRPWRRRCDIEKIQPKSIQKQ